MPFPEAGRNDAVVQREGARGRFRLDRATASLAAAGPVEAVLDELLEQTARLTGAGAAAVSLVDAAGDRYTKAAERGITCRVGSSFPLDEGATGRAVALRRPVVLDDYARLPAGHLDSTSAAAHRSVAAVPVWWRGEVVAVDVVFRPPQAGFSTVEVDRLEALAQAAAPAIARRHGPDASLGGELRRRIRDSGPASAASVIETGTIRGVDVAIAEAAAELLLALERAHAGSPATPLRVALVYGADRVRLLAQQEGPEVTETAWAPPELTEARGIGARFERVPGWGLVLRADLPYAVPAPPSSPLTARERQVLGRVRLGRTDRQIGAELRLSPRTVEKHVAGILAKTGARSRAAAVGTALEQGWLDPA